MKKSLSALVTKPFRLLSRTRWLAWGVGAFSLILCLSLIADWRSSNAFMGAVNITSTGTPFTQNFDTLPASGSATWTNDSTIPGWYHARTGTGTTIVANNGSSNAGNLYSYGTGTDTDRALGSVGSGNAAIGNLFWGVVLANQTASTITSLDVSYVGEQWRNSAAAAQTVAFSYLTGASFTGSLAEFQSAGTAVPALDFTSPITGGAAAALDGNLAANRVAISFTITGLSLAPGQQIFFRWSDPDHTGADHGLSIDNFSVTANGGPPTPILNISDVSMAEGDAGTTTFTFNVTLTAPAGLGGVTFDIATADGTAQDGNPMGEDDDYVAQSLTGQSIPAGSTGPYNFSVTVNGDTDVEPNETFFVNVTNVTGANVGDGQGQGTIVNDDVMLIRIHDVQGNGAATPILGATATVRGIVTLLRSNGFFLQEEDADVDADPNTSEGLFVFTSAAPMVAVGDQATVTGTVVEFNGLTEISTSNANVSVNSTGNPLPTAVTLTGADLPPNAMPGQPQLEKYEGMRVFAASLLTISPNDSFFDIDTVLGGVPREQVFREPGIELPDPVPPDPTSGVPDANVPRWDGNPERLNVDTNGRAGSTGEAITSNVTFTNVTGPLDFAFGRYRLIPEAPLTRTANISAMAIPQATANEYTIAGYNIENFNNNATQREKVSLTFRTILRYPDIVGVAEIFDLADLQALRDEINNDAVAAGDPNPMYEAFLIEADGVSEDNDQDVGFLVKTSRVSVTSVTQEREEETFIEPGTGATAILHDRPPLVLDAIVDPMGTNPQRVLVVVNHTRSFIGIEEDPGDGPRVREKRKLQAESLAGLLQELQTNNPTTPVVAVGDYNAFQFSDGYTDPINVIKGMPPPDDQVVVDASPDLVNPDFVNLIDELPADQKYTFVFEGTPQVLDHVLVNTVAHMRNTRIVIAHNNADFPGSPAAAFASNISRTEHNSDHDIPVAYFEILAPCVVTCPQNITVSNDTGQCGAVVNYDAPTTSGDCTNVVCSPPSGSFFPVGTTTVTCADQTGETRPTGVMPGDECMFTVTVNDTQPPMITCPENITREEQKPGEGANINYADPTVMDNCSGVTFNCVPPSGSHFSVGMTTVTCTATDAAMNTAMCTFTVTVTGAANCVITCPQDITVSNTPGQCGATVNYPPPTASKDCGTVTCTPPSGSFFPVGITEVGCSTTAGPSCTFNVTVNSTEALITCPANVSTSNDANQCGAVVNYPAPTLSPCFKATITCTPPSGSFFPVGTTTVMCSATDGTRTGNCSFTVTVNDTQPPTISCQSNVTTVAPATCPLPTGSVVTYATPTTTDNCPGATVACVPPSGGAFPVGTTTVTCTATDAAGNTASCSFSVAVFTGCLQDNANAGNVVLFNHLTGEYRFCCNGAVSASGFGAVSIRGCTVTITHNIATKRVSISSDFATKKGNASLQSPPGAVLCTINDSNILNNSCVCLVTPSK